MEWTKCKLILDIIYKNVATVLSKSNNHKNRLCEISADYANYSEKKDFMLKYESSSGTDKNKSWEDLEMIELIISILVPILGGLGVSEADVTTYVTNCSGYIYAILISILVLIVLLVAAHFIAPKGKRHLVRWGSGPAVSPARR